MSIQDKMQVIKKALTMDLLKTDRETYYRVIESIDEKYHMILVSEKLYQNKEFENWTCWVELSVSDTGIGISKQDLKTLFHPSIFIYDLIIDIVKFVVGSCRRDVVLDWVYVYLFILSHSIKGLWK